MTLTIQQLTKDKTNIDFNDICSSWLWHLTDQKAIALISAVGDLFFVANDQTINWLDTGTGQIKKVADNMHQFEQLLTDEANVDNWFLGSLVEQLIANGQTLKEDEVYSFKILPVLGGDYSVENLEPTNMSVHFAFTGQIHEQIKDLPNGTKINKVRFLKK